MTVVAIRTKTEQALIDGFEAAVPRLPGSGWVERLRRSAIETFAAEGLPHRRIEEWKYTDLRERLRDTPRTSDRGAARKLDRAAVDAALGSLAGLDAIRVVFVDGRIDLGLSDLASAPAGVELKPLGAQLDKSAGWLEGKFTAARVGARDAITALNLAFMSDGVLLKVASGVAATKPVLIVNLRSGTASAVVATRNIVSVEAGGRLTFVEAHVALAPSVSAGEHPVAFATDVDVADGARLDHIQLVAGLGAATHFAKWQVRIGGNATYRAFQLTAGVELARNELAIGFTGPDAKLDISGTFLARGSDHIDTTLVVDHSTTGCESRELFHGVLQDRGRGVFQGKIIVQPEAQKTDGKQMARALMLSPDAEFDSKPELEIYADDVVCGHGSTAAEIDADALFYLRSRGIPHDEARSMLVESFVGEALAKVEDETLREALGAVAVKWLQASAPGTSPEKS
jgi:Fe-S cluster assembly protein SufD